MKSKKLWLAAVVIISMLTTGCLSILGSQESQINKVETTMLDIKEQLVPQGKTEFDFVKAIKEHEWWLLQTPLSYEKAVQILGNDPGGSLLRFDIVTEPAWFQPLEKTYYSYVWYTLLPDAPEVVQIWYKDDASDPQYVVIRQTSAERYLEVSPHEKDGISFHPHFIVRLEDGTPVGLVCWGQTMDGTPFTPEWIQYIWCAEWITGGVRHSVTGTNLGSEDLLKIVADLSRQTVEHNLPSNVDF